MAKKNNPNTQSKVRSTKESQAVSHTSINENHAPWWPALIALLITAICFSTSLDNQFVNWDDDRNFYENNLYFLKCEGFP